MVEPHWSKRRANKRDPSELIEPKKPIKLHRYVENAPWRCIKQYNQPSECLKKCSQMYGLSEQNYNVTHYIYDISRMVFSKCAARTAWRKTSLSDRLVDYLCKRVVK